MPEIPQEVQMRIRNAALDLAFARSTLEKAVGWEEKQAAQLRFDACETAMVEAAMYVNRADYVRID